MKSLSLLSLALLSWLPHALHADTAEQLVSAAVAANAEIRYYESELTAAKAGKRTAGQIANPEFGTELGGKRVKDLTGASAGNGAVWRAEIAQSFEFPGRIALRKAIAERDIALAELGLMQFKSLLGNEVRTRAGDISLLRRKVDAIRSVRTRLEELVGVLMQRDTGNVSAKLERRILEATLLTTDRSLTDANKEAAEASATLNILCGRAPDAELKLDNNKPDLSPPPSLATLKEVAAKSNFDLLQKRVQLARQGLKIDLTKSERWGSIKVAPYIAGEQASDKQIEGGISFSIPLPLWNKSEGSIAAEQARQLGAEAMVAATLRDLERDLTVQRAHYAAELDSLSHWKPETEHEFQQAAEEADHHYRLGAVTAATYVEMQRGYLDALTALIETQHNAWKHRMELERLIGTRLTSQP